MDSKTANIAVGVTTAIALSGMEHWWYLKAFAKANPNSSLTSIVGWPWVSAKIGFGILATSSSMLSSQAFHSFQDTTITLKAVISTCELFMNLPIVSGISALDGFSTYYLGQKFYHYFNSNEDKKSVKQDTGKETTEESQTFSEDKDRFDTSLPDSNLKKVFYNSSTHLTQNLSLGIDEFENYCYSNDMCDTLLPSISYQDSQEL